MKLSVMYRKNSEQERPILEFKEMMRRRHPDIEINEIDLDTRSGAADANMYGVVQYPAILVTDKDGIVQGQWEGIPLPLIDEVFGSLLEQQGSSI